MKVKNENESTGAKYEYGICEYCGQTYFINMPEYETQEKRNAHVTKKCTCPEAETAARIAKQIEKGTKRVQELFGDVAEKYGFEPVQNQSAIETLCNMVSLIVHDVIVSATVQLNGRTRAKISTTSGGKIKIERTETTKAQLKE
ncbi:MAG: hypothetical protein LBS36_13635 [Oscillospiraceae bacterium]|jgi:hypothetical protein|nr:hypothetical protein [Oscillospiraceae bacterium]